MRIVYSKISDDIHRVTITRSNGGTESVELESRSYLRHDLAHYAIEREYPIHRGYWGCVAAGASLTGDGVSGSEAMFAETLAGPIQTLMRIEADLDAYARLLPPISEETGEPGLPERVHERIWQLNGHWKGTNFGKDMELEWPE